MNRAYECIATGPRARPGLAAGATLAGLGLLASYLLVRAKTRQAERDNPPQGKFVTVDGVRLHYLERGEGPTLVLLHGNGTYSRDFEISGLIDSAAGHYRVIAFDRPGFGYSERPRDTMWTPDNQARLLHHALQALGVDNAIVLGHSWGTLVALAMGLRVPHFVRGLVLVSGYYYPSPRLDVALSSPPALPVVGDLMRYTVAPIAGRLLWRATLKRAFTPQKIPASYRAMPAWMALRPSQLRASAAEAALMVPSALAMARRYARLKVPVRVLAGTRDAVADCTHNAERLHERLQGWSKNSELGLEPGVGHMLHHAHPEKVLAAIDAIATQAGVAPALHNPRAEALARASESGV